MNLQLAVFVFVIWTKLNTIPEFLSWFSRQVATRATRKLPELAKRMARMADGHVTMATAVATTTTTKAAGKVILLGN